MNSEPAKTPPAHRVILTHEQLVQQVRELHDRDASTFAQLRNIESRMEAHHLAQMEQLGILARAIRQRRTLLEWLGLR